MKRVLPRLLSLALALTVTFTALGPGPVGVAAAPGRVRAVGDTLRLADGSPFFLLGANYVGGPDRSWTMWQDDLFDAGLVERDFVRARGAGLHTLRLFVRAPLPQQIQAGQWGKLDSAVALAEKHGLALIVTLHDYREDDLAKVAAVNAAIAGRYTGSPAILAYDVKNEPQYQDLAISIYPGERPPLQTEALIATFGERVTPVEADAWRQFGGGKDLVPARFTAEEAYVYANNYRYYQEFVAESGAWVTDRNYEASIFDYLTSSEAGKWQPFLATLDATLAAWLRPQIEAVRAGDGERLLTTGYSNAILASLKANETLGFVSFHRFPALGLRPLEVTLAKLDDLQQIFPDKPVTFEEFGYPNSAVDDARGAVYETAVFLHLLGQGRAGGAKWSLYDVAEGWSERENSFGMFRADGSAKPVVSALQSLARYLEAAGRPPSGSLRLEGEPGGIRYVYSAADALFVAGQAYADPSGRLSFEAASPTQVFAFWPRGNEIELATTGPATVRVDPGALTGLGSASNLSLVRADGTAVPFERVDGGLRFGAEGAQRYRLRFSIVAADARIEIVWPHDGKPVREAEKANVGAYLFTKDSDLAFCGQPTPTVRLWRSLNNGVAEPVAVGEPRLATVEGVSFTAWDFNDVDVAAARDPGNKYYFSLSVDEIDYRSSIWSHAEDARTYLPNQEVPEGVGTGTPGTVDAKIQIVWPHDGLPVDQATKANVGVTIFQRGSALSVPADWSPTVRLWRTLNNGYGEQVATGHKVLKSEGGLTSPAWEFNDVDVSAARDPLNKYYFRVSVDGVDSRGNVWSHGADARTYFPRQDVPTGVSVCQ